MSNFQLLFYTFTGPHPAPEANPGDVPEVEMEPCGSWSYWIVPKVGASPNLLSSWVCWEFENWAVFHLVVCFLQQNKEI